MTDLDDAWDAATRAPFLEGVRDGTLAPEDFDRWLGQDRLFVADLLAFQARLLARAPRDAQAVLAGGCVALVEELAWFDELAAARGLAPARPAAVTRDYAGLLRELDEAPYAVAVTALEALERVYLLAWQAAAPGAGPYRACVEHWTDPGFAAYVDALGRAARAAGAPQDALPRVLALEAAFWDAR